MTTARKPKFIIRYEGKDITTDLSSYLLSVDYSDKERGETDELCISLEDSEGLWRNEWWPTKGDKLNLDFGYDEFVTDAGTFTIDEIEVSGPPDVVMIRGVASWITTAMRTKESKAYEGQTLKQIAETIAAKHGLTVEGRILTMRIARSTQHRETDLEYLKRLADEFGYQFSIKGTKLVFENIFEIEKGLPVVTIDRSELISYSLREKGFDTYKSAKVKYHDPKEKKVVEATVTDVENGAGENFSEKTAADTLEIRTKTEDKAQAELKAKAALYRSRSNQVEGSLTLIGNPVLVAGNNFELTNMGQLSGRYHITESRHSITRSGGYTTSIEVKRVGYVVKEKQKSTRKRKPPKYNVRVIE